MRRYVSESEYTPLLGLSDWIASRSDDDVLARAARPFDDDIYKHRVVDIREPALLEPRSGYVFLRSGVYRPSFNWWEFADGPHLRAFRDYAAWLVRRGRVQFLPEAVSLRTQWEGNYWHCHDEILTKLILVDRAGLPRDIPLLVSPVLWNAPYFREMRSARALQDRNWVLHDKPIWSPRLHLCIQGPTSPENIRYEQDLFRAADRPAAVTKTAPFLFVVRPRTVERHFENEAELRAELAGFGFEAIEPDRLPFWEQVERFRAAQCVVTAHGAALANLVHRADTPTGLIELFPNEEAFLGRIIGPWMSREAGFAYRAVLGSPMSPSRGFAVRREALADAVGAVFRELQIVEPGR